MQHTGAQEGAVNAMETLVALLLFLSTANGQLPPFPPAFGGQLPPFPPAFDGQLPPFQPVLAPFVAWVVGHRGLVRSACEVVQYCTVLTKTIKNQSKVKPFVCK